MIRNRRQLRQSMEAIKLACKILTCHMELLALALLLLAGYVLFVSIWLIFATRMVLLRMAATGDGFAQSPATVTLALYFGLVLVWTTGVFTSLFRITIALVTAQWYFYRHEDAQLGISGVTHPAFNLVVQRFMGSVCLSGLVLSITQLLDALAAGLLFLFRPLRLFPFPLLLRWALGCHSITHTLNGMTILYVGLTGRPFFSSASAVKHLMKRNRAFAAQNALVINTLLRLSTGALAVMAGSLASAFAITDFHAQYPYGALACSIAVSWVILRFFGRILTYTVDTILVCFIIDVDSETNHSNEARAVFAQASV
ncbi:hypothetical protein H4R35_007099 [Dimargaris xerosporica]|nr:hypothetical protein H4R35_007099 [Dimargaris xerosporica]